MAGPKSTINVDDEGYLTGSSSTVCSHSRILQAAGYERVYIKTPATHISKHELTIKDAGDFFEGIQIEDDISDIDYVELWVGSLLIKRWDVRKVSGVGHKFKLEDSIPSTALTDKIVFKLGTASKAQPHAITQMGILVTNDARLKMCQGVYEHDLFNISLGIAWRPKIKKHIVVERRRKIFTLVELASRHINNSSMTRSFLKTYLTRDCFRLVEKYQRKKPSHYEDVIFP